MLHLTALQCKLLPFPTPLWDKSHLLTPESAVAWVYSRRDLKMEQLSSWGGVLFLVQLVVRSSQFMFRGQELYKHW